MDLRISVKEIKPFSVSGISNGNFLFDTNPEVQEVSTSVSSNMVTGDNNTLNENSLLDATPKVQEFATPVPSNMVTTPVSSNMVTTPVPSNMVTTPVPPLCKYGDHPCATPVQIW